MSEGGAGAPLAPQTVCDRCGAFVATGEALVLRGARRCPSCFERGRAELKAVKLYANWYIWVCGLLFGPILFGPMAAVNWHRLGRPRRRNQVLLGMVLGLVLMGVANVLSGREELRLVGRAMRYPVSIPLLFFFTAGMKPELDEHLAAGGRRTWWMPIVFALCFGALFLVLGMYQLYSLAPVAD